MKIYIYLFLALFTASRSYAQQTPKKLLYGKITAASVPAAGATILLKKGATKIIADQKGNFSLSWDQSADTLQVVLLGYLTRSVPVGPQTVLPLNIHMHPSETTLDEVTISVNTGYQTLSKERATGSFVQIDNKLFNEQAGTSILERLKYISNGVAPMSNRVITGEDKLLIRGLSTLTMSIQSPLIILDNFEYKGDINNLNPNDVESITFLKDAAAGSIWGAKAANGVIVITSKKGSYNQKTRVSINTNLMVTEKPDLYRLPDISGADLIQVERLLFNQKYRFADTIGTKHPAFSPAYEIMFKEKNGQLSTAQASAQLEQLGAQDLRDDYSRYLYRQGFSQQHALSLSGGSENHSWTLGSGLDKTSGTLHEENRRLNLRAGNSYRPVKNLELSTNIHFTQSESQSGAPAYGSILTNYGRVPTYVSLAGQNGEALPMYHQYREGYIDNLGGGKLLDWRFYPLEDYKHNRTTSELQDLNAVLGLNYKIGKMINIDLKYRYEKQDVHKSTLADQQSYYTRDLINSFTQISGTSTLYKVPKGDILDLGLSQLRAQNIRGQLNLDHSWKAHSLQAIAGSEFSEAVEKGNSYRTYGFNADILGFVPVDLANSYPNFITGSSFIPRPQSFSQTNTRFASFYGNAAYTYKNQYTLSASARRDASNIFGVEENDKWKPLWSAGAAWEVSKATFYKSDLLPLLKLRLTYGSQGNVDPSKVAVLTLKYENASPFTFTPTASFTNYVNPDLKWEQVNMLNLALDFGFKDNRVSGSIEYYKKSLTDLYGPSAIDLTTGLGMSTIVKNIGQMRGSGLDVQLNSLNTIGSIKWSSSVIFNTYTDKVTKYNDPSAYNPSALVGNSGSMEGNPSAYLAVFRSAGLDPATGDPLGYLNGTVSKDWAAITGSGGTQQDIRYVGRRIPPVYGSVGNNLSWKGFSLALRMTYKFGYYFLRESIDYTALTSTLTGHADYAKRWQKTGDEAYTSVPSMVYPSNLGRRQFYKNSEPLVEKGDHIRLQYINFSYLLSKTQLKQLPFSSIQLFGVMNNIGVLWKESRGSLDPDFSSLPPGATYSFGLKLNY